MPDRRALTWFLPLCVVATAMAQQEADANALRQRAFAAENAGRFGEAADAFLLLHKAEPQRVDWIVAAGRCLGRSGRRNEALELLDGARRTFPDAIEVRTMLARTLILSTEAGDALHPEIRWAEAAEIAEGVLAQAPNDEEARLLLAQARYLQGDVATAERHVRFCIEHHPTRPGAHVLLGRMAFDRFRFLLEQKRAGTADAKASADLDAAVATARREALAALTKASELDPARAHPHLLLGQLAWLDHKPEAARESFAAALVREPNTPLDHDRLTEGLTWQQRADLYRGLCERHLARPGASPKAAATLRFHEGRARFEGREWQDAGECFAAALQDDPAATNNLYYAFLCRYELGDHDAAEAFAARYAAESAPKFADVLRALDGDRRGAIAAVLRFLADRAYQAGRLSSSRDLNHVIACLRDDADAWNNHAFLCRETGDFDAAFTSYQHAIEKEPDSPQLWNDAAVVLQHHLKGAANLAKARTMYERALQLADKALADGKLPEMARQRAAKAKADATANLAELGP